MLSIAVCDDEILECHKTAEQIRHVMEERKASCLVACFYSGKELLEAAEHYDIIFLDILMGGLDGMKTAELLRESRSDTILIFVSSSRAYVFDAYEVEAFQYLIKPLDNKKLQRVLDRALLKTEEKAQDYLIINREREKKKLFLDDIYYFEIRGRMIDIHGKKGICSYYGRIGVLEEELKEKGFFRCHKSYLINLKYVESYNRQEAVLENGDCIVIAKRRFEEFAGAVLFYMREHGGIV